MWYVPRFLFEVRSEGGLNGLVIFRPYFGNGNWAASQKWVQDPPGWFPWLRVMYTNIKYPSSKYCNSYAGLWAPRQCGDAKWPSFVHLAMSRPMTWFTTVVTIAEQSIAKIFYRIECLNWTNLRSHKLTGILISEHFFMQLYQSFRLQSRIAFPSTGTLDHL